MMTHDASGSLYEIPYEGDYRYDRGRSSTFRSSQPIWDPWAEPGVPVFPMDVLPLDVARYVEARGIETGACRSAIAMACLTTASGSVDHRIKLFLKPGNHYPVAPRLWTMLVGNPSSKKSPAQDGATSPLLAHQKAIQAEQWEEFRRKQEEDGNKSKDTGPDLSHFIVSDLTPEALASALSKQDRGILVSVDELAGWFGGLDRYGSGKGASSGRALWLQSYNGGFYNMLRIGRPTLPVNNLSASILGGIQIDRLKELGTLTSDGLLQRFLPVWMAKPVMDRNDFAYDAWRLWSDHVRNLLAYGPFSTSLSGEAQSERERMARLLFDIGQIESEGAAWQGFVGKLSGVWGSLAILLHVMWGKHASDPVDLDTARRSSRVLEDFILPHSLAFYRSLRGATQSDNKAIAGFLAGWEGTTVTVRDLNRGPRCCRQLTPEEIAKKMLPFEAGGWLEPEEVAPWNRTWTLEPGLAERFSEELQRHREAMATLQEKISGASDED